MRTEWIRINRSILWGQYEPSSDTHSHQRKKNPNRSVFPPTVNIFFSLYCQPLFINILLIKIKTECTCIDKVYKHLPQSCKSAVLHYESHLQLVPHNHQEFTKGTQRELVQFPTAQDLFKSLQLNWLVRRTTQTGLRPQEIVPKQQHEEKKQNTINVLKLWQMTYRWRLWVTCSGHRCWVRPPALERWAWKPDWTKI